MKNAYVKYQMYAHLANKGTFLSKKTAKNVIKVVVNAKDLLSLNVQIARVIKYFTIVNA